MPAKFLQRVAFLRLDRASFLRRNPRAALPGHRTHFSFRLFNATVRTSAMAARLTIGFLGAGKMATALARGFLRAGLVTQKDLIASDVAAGARTSFGKATGAKTTNSNVAITHFARDPYVTT